MAHPTCTTCGEWTVLASSQGHGPRTLEHAFPADDGHAATGDMDMSPCTDCGTPVPTIATGEGYATLTRCPAASERHRNLGQDGHRVSREAYTAAIAAVQA